MCLLTGFTQTLTYCYCLVSLRVDASVKGMTTAPGHHFFLRKSIAFVSHHLNVISRDSTDSCHFVKARVTEV